MSNTNPLSKLSFIPQSVYLDEEINRSFFASDVLYTSDGSGLIPFGTFEEINNDVKLQSCITVDLFDGKSYLFSQTIETDNIEIYESVEKMSTGTYITTISSNRLQIKIPNISTATGTFLVIDGKIREIFDNNGNFTERLVTINNFDDEIVNILYINGVYCIIGNDRKIAFTNALTTTIDIDINNIITIPTSADDYILNGIVSKNILYLFTKKSILIWRGKTSFNSLLPVTYMHSYRRYFKITGTHSLIEYKNRVFAVGADEIGATPFLFEIFESSQEPVSEMRTNLSLIAEDFSISSFFYESHNYLKVDPIYDDRFFSDGTRGFPHENQSIVFNFEKNSIFIANNIMTLSASPRPLDETGIYTSPHPYHYFFYFNGTNFCIDFTQRTICNMRKIIHPAQIYFQFRNISGIYPKIPLLFARYKGFKSTEKEFKLNISNTLSGWADFEYRQISLKKITSESSIKYPDRDLRNVVGMNITLDTGLIAITPELGSANYCIYPIE